MTQNHFRAVTLAAGLGLFSTLCFGQLTNSRGITNPRQTQQANVPAEFQGAISQLISAKSSLEKAGDRWGGHRVKAIHMIDEALAAAGRPQQPSRGEMKSGNTDEPAALESGMSGLQSAKSDFERSGNQWGGRREKALSFINGALGELNTGIEYAKAHHTY